MGIFAKIVRLGVMLAVLTLLLCTAAYLTLTEFISIRNVTCFGLFGSNKPFVEMQSAKEVAYVFSQSVLVYEKKTAYQFVEVYNHPFFGNILVIDGALQITQRDEVNYHEMTVHVPMAYLLSSARRALIIGGGDGGALYRLLQYKSLTEVDLVDIDLTTIKGVTQRYFPELYGGFMDRRTRQHMIDGNLWVDEQRERRQELIGASTMGNTDVSGRGRPSSSNGGAFQPIDLIIIDSTDYGSAETLFTDYFYRRLKELMSDRSILVVNLDSPSWNTQIVAMVQQQLATIFTFAFVYHSHQPTFLSGHYSYLFLSDSIHPMTTPIDWSSWTNLRLSCHYYNPEIHFGSFLLHEDIRRRLTMSAQLKDVMVATSQQQRDGSDSVVASGGVYPLQLDHAHVPRRVELPQERSRKVAEEAQLSATMAASSALASATSVGEEDL